MKSNYKADNQLEATTRNFKLVVFDFDGVFTNNMVLVFENGIEAVQCYRSNGLGLRKLDNLGVRTVVLSTETNQVVSLRCKKLKIECIQGCKEKCTALEAYLSKVGLSFEQIAFVGNDINDLTCMKSVRLPIAVNDAYPEVLSVAKYKTETKGGYGAVREVCDLFENVLNRPDPDAVYLEEC